MKERLEEQWLLTVTVSENDVHWIKPGKEIWLNNRMFDIKTTRIENGTYTFTGLYDDDETRLVKQLQKNQQENSTNNKVLAQLFQLWMLPYDNLASPLIFDNKTTSEFVAIANTPLSTQYVSIITPPPQA